MRYVGVATLYAVLNFRYAALVLPVGVVAYLLGLPAWLVTVAVVLVAGAFAAELLTSITNGVSTAAQMEAHRSAYAKMMSDAERYANGGWVGLNGNGKEDGTGQGQGRPDDGEGEAPVPAKG